MADEQDLMYMGDENQGMDTGDNNSGNHEPMEDSFEDDGDHRNGGARDRSRSPIDRSSGKKKRGNLTSKIVYVHNLSYQCTWQQLKDFFKENVGEVKFAELVMKPNGDPSGVGAVQFNTFEKAQQAIDQVNGVKFMDRVLTIKSDTKSSSRLNKIVGSRGDRRGGMRSDYDDYSGKMGGGYMGGNFGGRGMGGGMGGGFGGNTAGFGGALGDTGGVDPLILDALGIIGPVTSSVFVGNLNYDKTSESSIREVFSLAGEIKDIELFEDKDGTFLGRAVVRYSEPIEAVQAISMLHNQNLHDRNIIVSMDKKADKGGKLVKNLPSGLKSVGMGLGVCGAPMTKSEIMRFRDNIDPMILQQLGIEGSITNKVFVANLHFDKSNEESLKEVFSIAGEVESVELFRDKDGVFDGKALIEFDEPLEAVQAISMFSDQNLWNRTILVRMDFKGNQGNRPKKLPSGLKSVGQGLGVGGAPLKKGQKPCLDNIGGVSRGSNFGGSGMGSNMGGMGSGMSSGMGNMGNMGMGNNMGSGMGGNMGGGMGGNMGGFGQSNMGGGGGFSNMGSGNMGSGNMGSGYGSGNMGGNMGSNMSGNMGGNMGGKMGGNMGGNMGSGMGGNMGGGMGSGNMGGGMGGGMGNMGSGMGGGMSNMGGGMGGGMGNMGSSNSMNSGFGSNMGNSGMGGGFGGSSMGSSGMGGGFGSSGLSSGMMGRSGGGMSSGWSSGMGSNMRRSGGMGRTKRDSESGSSRRGGGGDSRDNRDPDRFIMIRQTDPSKAFPFRSWQSMKDAFAHTGDAAFAAIRSEAGSMQKYGIIRFNDVSDARNAVSVMNETEYNGQILEVGIAPAREDNY